MRTHTTHTRDAALGKLRRINGWIIAGSVALTAVLSDVAANAFPGKTIKASSSKSRGSVKHSSTTSTAPAKPLAPPSQAPEASAPSQEPQESPSQQSAPSPEAQQATPAPEAQPSETQQAAPEAPREEAAPESSPPVVSGGS
jgi:hypothetical protein